MLFPRSRIVQLGFKRCCNLVAGGQRNLEGKTAAESVQVVPWLVEAAAAAASAALAGGGLVMIVVIVVSVTAAAAAAVVVVLLLWRWCSGSSVL